MKYDDAFEDCLARLKRGESLKNIIGRYPEHASRLRDDLVLAADVRQQALPARPGSEQRAWSLLQTELRAQRQLRSRRLSLAGRLLTPFTLIDAAPGLFRRAGLAAAVVAVVAVVALAVSTVSGGPDLSQPVTSLVGSSNAEAASFDGVVVDNANGLLTVQTSTSLESVSAASATIGDTSGQNLALPDLMAGQVVSIKGKRLGNGSVAASHIDRQNVVALRDWCSANTDECQKLRDRLETVVSQCQTSNGLACQGLALRLNDLRERLGAAATQLEDLKGRCDRGGALACRELKRLCDQYKNLCKAASQKTAGPKGRQ